MKRYNLKLTGTLTTLSPFAVVPPGADDGLLPDGGKYNKIARTVVYDNGLRDIRPVIPGSTLRGRLRRAAVDAYLSLSGEKIPLSEWHQNAVGGVKGAGKEDGFDITLRGAIRDRNPVISLFGSGDPWIASRVKIESAIPNHSVETNVVSGVRTDDGRRDNSFFEKLDDSAADDWLSLVGLNATRTKFKGDLKKLEGDLRKARKEKNAAEVDRLSAEVASLKKSDEATTTKSNPVSLPIHHEAIPAGVSFRHAITLAAVTEEEIGLFFAAFNGFMKAKPAVGQHENLGYGLFNGTYNLRLEDTAGFDPFQIGVPDAEELGTLTIEPYEGFVDVPERIVSCMSAFKRAFETGAYDFGTIKAAAAQVPETVSGATE